MARTRVAAVRFGRAVRLALVVFFAAGLTLVGVVVSAPDAGAYTRSGCTWDSPSQKIETSGVGASYIGGLRYAKENYNARTDVELTLTKADGPRWTAATGDYGATGWEAIANWNSNCETSGTYICRMRVNKYYVPATAGAARHKVIWAHEMGHCLGLNHVSASNHVMYTSASTAYRAGVRGLTADEVTGINALY